MVKNSLLSDAKVQQSQEEAGLFENVGHRLQVIVDELGEKEAATCADKSVKQLRRYISGQEPPLGVVSRLCEASSASLSWVVDGEIKSIIDIDFEILSVKNEIKKMEGAPRSSVESQELYALSFEKIATLEKMKELRMDIAADSAEAPSKKSGILGALKNAEEFAFVPRLNILASAGNGSVTISEEADGMLAFRHAWLRRRGINPNRTSVLTATGDSMEPTIRDGDILLVDQSIDYVKDNGIYVVVIGGLVVVKRVHTALDGSVTLISENTIYPPETVSANEAEDLIFAGRVMWFGRSI